MYAEIVMQYESCLLNKHLISDITLQLKLIRGMAIFNGLPQRYVQRQRNIGQNVAI